MKKIFERNQTIFSVLWIVIYVVSLSIADNISRSIGVEKLITLPVSILLFIVIIAWISKNNLRQYYGLCLIKGFDFKKYLYFLPLVIISTPNLWNGVTMRFAVKETILYALSMIMVGFLEEIIFRGMLFQALKIENVYRAIIVSSLMFGVGHIVNFQILYLCIFVFGCDRTGLSDLRKRHTSRKHLGRLKLAALIKIQQIELATIIKPPCIH